MAGTTTTLAFLLKQIYSSRAVENAVYESNPLFAMMRKEGGFTGSKHIHAVKYRDGQGRNPTFSTAQTIAQSAAGTGNGVQFGVTRVKNYQVYTLETEAILAGRDDRGSLMRTLTEEVDGALNNLGRDISVNMFRDGAGDRGQVTNVNSLILTVGENVTNFEVGMIIVASTGSTKTAILRNSGTGQTVTAVDRDAGTITIDANTDTITANDWLFVKGDRQVAAITANSQYLKLAGLDAWNPATAPAASENFFDVDRSVDTSRLGGLRLDISSYNPEEGVITALTRMAREGHNPQHLFTSFLDGSNIHKSLGSKAETEYTQVGDIGFSTIRFTGPKGDVRLQMDQNCPAGVGRLITLDTWALKHLGDMINLLDLDGARLSREESADRFEGRMALYGNIVCYAPAKNMRLVLPS